MRAERLVYGEDNVLFAPIESDKSGESGELSFSPSASMNLSGGVFSMNCLPSEDTPWLNLDDATGVITIRPDQVPNNTFGVADIREQGKGIKCRILWEKMQSAGTLEDFSVWLLILLPTPWAGVSWSMSTIQQTIGVASPPTIPMDSLPRAWSLPPTSFAAACSSGNTDVAFKFDVLTGQATLDGHEAFVLDTSTGILVSRANSSLSYIFDADKAQRRSLSLNCTVFGHYDWRVGHRITVSGRISIELMDDTCWKPLASSKWQISEQVDANSSSKCKSACRSMANCSHYRCLGVSKKCRIHYPSFCLSQLTQNPIQKILFRFEHPHPLLVEILWGRAPGTLGLGTRSRQGDPGVGHSGDSGLGTPLFWGWALGTPGSWALQSPGAEHSRDTLLEFWFQKFGGH